MELILLFTAMANLIVALIKLGFIIKSIKSRKNENPPPVQAEEDES